MKYKIASGLLLVGVLVAMWWFASHSGTATETTQEQPTQNNKPAENNNSQYNFKINK